MCSEYQSVSTTFILVHFNNFVDNDCELIEWSLHVLSSPPAAVAAAVVAVVAVVAATAAAAAAAAAVVAAAAVAAAAAVVAAAVAAAAATAAAAASMELKKAQKLKSLAVVGRPSFSSTSSAGFETTPSPGYKIFD